MDTARRGGLSLGAMLRFLDIATDALAQAREEIDALNVYPVPDGDTGTNMYLTVLAARDALRAATPGRAADQKSREGNGERAGSAESREQVQTAIASMSRGALLGARGNSGVILSEMIGALARRVGRAGAEERTAAVLADALREGTDASYAAVGTPVEGTILSVSRAASDAAVRVAADPDVRAGQVFTAAAEAAREALARTPEQLPVLAEAGVVDAGGRGLSVILDAAETSLTGRRPVPVASPIGTRAIPVPRGPESVTCGPGTPNADLHPDGPAYEVMYLLDAGQEEIPTLRESLAGLGDSLVVVGGEGLWNVHVHVDDVGAALEAGIEAGRPHRIRVTHFAQQQADRARAVEAAPTGRAVVAVAAGPGLAELFAEAGAGVVPGGPGQRPSAGQLLEAITGTGAAEVVLLPNDADSVKVAEAAARTAEADAGGAVRVTVIPSQSQVQGLAAMAVHEPGRSFEQDVLEMTATARHVAQGAVTVAARRAMTMAGPCEPGDALGVVAGDFVVVGGDVDAVATEVLERLLGGGGELVTLVSGAEDPDGRLAAACAAWLERTHPVVDVVVYDGGQERYPLLMSVE